MIKSQKNITDQNINNEIIILFALLGLTCHINLEISNLNVLIFIGDLMMKSLYEQYQKLSDIYDASLTELTIDTIQIKKLMVLKSLCYLNTRVLKKKIFK